MDLPEGSVEVDLTCPHCQAHLTAAAASHGETVQPGPGNFFLCGECGQAGRMEATAFGIIGREVYNDEMSELPPDLIRVAFAIQQQLYLNKRYQNPN